MRKAPKRRGVHQKRNYARRRKPDAKMETDEDFWDSLCIKYNEENHWKKKVGRPKKTI